MAKKAAKTKEAKTPIEVSEVSMTVGVTIPLGNYRSVRYDLGMSARHPEGKGYNRAEVDEICGRLQKTLEKKIESIQSEYEEKN